MMDMMMVDAQGRPLANSETGSPSRKNSRAIEKTNLTLAIKTNVVDSLRKEAEAQGQSLNAKASQILSNYVTFYKHSEDLESVIIPHRIFVLMLASVDEKLLQGWINLAINEIWPAIPVGKESPVSIETFSSYTFGEIALNAGLFVRFKSFVDNESYLCLVFEHRYGSKWSRILAETFSNLLIKVFRAQVNHVITPNAVVLRILVEDN